MKKVLISLALVCVCALCASAQSNSTSKGKKVVSQTDTTAVSQTSKTNCKTDKTTLKSGDAKKTSKGKKVVKGDMKK